MRAADVATGLWGVQQLLAAMAMGCTGAVGSTYNYMAPEYHRMIAAFKRGDMDAARTHQVRRLCVCQSVAAACWLVRVPAPDPHCDRVHIDTCDGHRRTLATWSSSCTTALAMGQGATCRRRSWS